MWIANASRSREIDRIAIEERGIDGRILMERAGAEAFRILRKTWPSAARIVVLCGRGNNGGDGFVVAALAARAGLNVTCLVADGESQLSKDAAHQYAVAKRARAQTVFAGDPTWSKRLEELDNCDLIVDALLGTGARGSLEGAYLEAVRAANSTDVPVLSIDIPTGIECDTGRVMGDAIWAHTTVTFGLPKPFLFAGEGPDHSGKWTEAAIGYPEDLLNHPLDARLLTVAEVGEKLPVRWHTSHKGTSGHVMIVAGSRRYRGAAALAAVGASRAGAGLITVAGIEAVCEAVAAQVPEATFLPLAENEGVIDPSAMGEIEAMLPKVDSLVVGPGLTSADSVRGFLEALFPLIQCPVVLDADALNLLAAGVNPPAGPAVLTPHPGEFARLTGEDPQGDRFRAIRRYPVRGDQAVLLKGAFSLVAAQGEPVAVCPTGNPGMATAGMGDVLSGVIGTLLAQGLPAYDAAGSGAVWHGLAGDLCAEEIGPIGFSAWDLAMNLPKARAKMNQP